MDNLVERLRDLAHSRDCMGYDATAEKMREAADRIERLEKALREIAENTKRKQLPLTHIINGIAVEALEQNP